MVLPFLAPLFATAAATSATIGAAATIAGSAISARNNNRNNKRNVRAQQDLNEKNIAESRRADLLNHTRTLEAEKRDRARALSDQAMLRSQAISDRDEHRAYNDPAAARARAEAAGFNPLAVTDQSGGFVTAGTAVSPTNIAPASAVVPRLGRAVTQAYTGWGDTFSRVASLQMQKSQLELDNKRLEIQYLKAVQRPTKQGIYGVSKKSYTNNSLLSTTNPDGVAPSGADLLIDGNQVTVDQKTSGAEGFEERYGDIGSSIVGLGIGLKDVHWNNYLIKRRKDGVIDLRFLQDEYARKGIRPRARPYYLGGGSNLKKPPKISFKSLPNLGRHKDSFGKSTPRIQWYY